MFKNLTLRQISTYVTACVWLVQLTAIVLLNLLCGLPPISLWIYFIYAILSFCVTFLVIIFLFENFVYRKIKLIYKVISDSKDSLRMVKDIKIEETVLDKVNESVLEWANAKNAELTQLKSLEEYRKKYVGDISHELKTPLFSIQGYLFTLLEGGVYDERINIKYLKNALRNTDRLQSIVDDLEIINELESETINFKYQNFDIKELCVEVFSDLELMAKELDIKLMFKQGDHTSFNVYADRGKIRQVILNLIDNSLKYGKHYNDGNTKISFYDMVDVVLVEVSDNGIGIKESDLKYVFDRFYRTDLSRSQKLKGTGLGLSIVKHIVEAHGQRMTVRSTYGKGSTFGFTIRKSK